MCRNVSPDDPRWSCDCHLHDTEPERCGYCKRECIGERWYASADDETPYCSASCLAHAVSNAAEAAQERQMQDFYGGSAETASDRYNRLAVDRYRERGMR